MDEDDFKEVKSKEAEQIDTTTTTTVKDPTNIEQKIEKEAEKIEHQAVSEV